MRNIRNTLARWYALLAGLLSANAAILVGPTGSTVETFNTQPAATEWSTGSLVGNAASYSTPAALDQAWAGEYATTYVTALGSSSSQPPSPANIARRNTSASQGLYVQVRPNNDRAAVVLMATLQNDTGGVVRYLNVSYTFGLVIAAGSVAAEQIPGWRAFYSMDGEAFTWRPIPQFTTGTPGDLAASLDVGEWAHGSTMFIAWVDDESSSHTTAPNLEGAYTLDNFQAVPSEGRESSLVAFRSSALGWTAVFEDGTGRFALNLPSFTATLDGNAITPTAVKEGDVVTVSFTTPLQAGGSTHDLVLNYTDSSTPPTQLNLTRSYTVNPYQIVPAAFRAAGVDTASSGVRGRVHQIPGPRYPGDRNSTLNAERQLLNVILEPGTEFEYLNYAQPSLEPDGLYTLPIVNLNQVSAPEFGNFTSQSEPSRGDQVIPGIDGTAGNDNIAADFMTFIELRAGVIYTMGVNSDDGFKVTVGPNPRDAFAMNLGEFNGGRGSADTLFDFMVEADGIYPFRLLWWEGTGDASVEWFTVDAVGNKILLNDREVANHVKAYAVGPALPPYAVLTSGAHGDTNAPANVVLQLVIEDGSTTVSAGGVQLFINGENVTANATITKAEGSTRTVVTYDPPGDLAPETRLNVRLSYTDSASVTRTGEYWVQVKARVLVGIDDTTIWRLHAQLDESVPTLRLRGVDLGTAWREPAYEDTDANGWVDARTLIADETGAVAEPIRTLVARHYDPVNAPGISAMTMYTRTRFNFEGNPGSVVLLLRHVVDDGAVFYLNGIELHRFGVAANVNPVLYTTGSGGNENASRGPFLVPRAALRQGLNVLAAETHQEATSSSDIVFGAELTVVGDPTAAPARVATISPANGATSIRVNAPIAIQMEDGSTAVDPTTVRLFINDQQVTASVNKPAGGILTTVDYTPTTPYPAESTVNGRLEFRDNTGTLRTENFSFSTLPVLLVDINATQMWRVHAVLDETVTPAVLRLRGEDLGTEWRNAAYQDTDANGWVSGAAMIGDEAGATAEPLRTRLSRFYDPVNAPGISATTMYTRTTFNFDGDPATARLRVRHAVDDGVVIYLNGQEIHRFWMAEGDVTYATFAGVGFTPTDHENTYEGPFDVSSAALVRGQNVIAAETHQNGTGSSDIVFGLQLQLLAPSQPTETRFTAITLENGQVRLTWEGPGTLEERASLSAGSWTPVQGATSGYTTSATSGNKFFRIVQ